MDHKQYQELQKIREKGFTERELNEVLRYQHDLGIKHGVVIMLFFVVCPLIVILTDLPIWADILVFVVPLIPTIFWLSA
ncbi:MAG: hypothetical protein HYW70_00305 [Candidatus Nealsonbacteria bacterium]|nr:hypothetical protein [Candidatus Nealsonbacteria bacterium]